MSACQARGTTGEKLWFSLATPRDRLLTSVTFLKMIPDLADVFQTDLTHFPFNHQHLNQLLCDNLPLIPLCDDVCKTVY